MNGKTPVVPILDHIVVLVSFETLQGLDKRVQSAFNVVAGGGNTAGPTINKLIFFEDGSYLEVVAFNAHVTPEQKKTHRWGHLPENSVIDWAYTLEKPEDFEAIQSRVSSTQAFVSYPTLTPGGRIKPDGTELKWAIAMAAGDALSTGQCPFWCLDKTPRENRVPYQSGKLPNGIQYTHHPCVAKGVSQLKITAPENAIQGLRGAHNQIHGVEAASEGPQDSWNFGAHSGVPQGAHQIALEPAAGGMTGITLTLAGSDGSPKEVELLPGVTFKIVA